MFPPAVAAGDAEHARAAVSHGVYVKRSRLRFFNEGLSQRVARIHIVPRSLSVHRGRRNARPQARESCSRSPSPSFLHITKKAFYLHQRFFDKLGTLVRKTRLRQQRGRAASVALENKFGKRNRVKVRVQCPTVFKIQPRSPFPCRRQTAARS